MPHNPRSYQKKTQVAAFIRCEIHSFSAFDHVLKLHGKTAVHSSKLAESTLNRLSVDEVPPCNQLSLIYGFLVAFLAANNNCDQPWTRMMRWSLFWFWLEIYKSCFKSAAHEINTKMQSNCDLLPILHDPRQLMMMLLHEVGCQTETRDCSMTM